MPWKIRYGEEEQRGVTHKLYNPSECDKKGGGRGRVGDDVIGRGQRVESMVMDDRREDKASTKSNDWRGKR